MDPPPPDLENGVVIQMDDVNEDPERDFTVEFYETVKDYHQLRAHPTKLHFLHYNMTRTAGSQWWWMEDSHPFARILASSGKTPDGVFSGALGRMVVFGNEEVKLCLQFVVELCEKYGLEIE